MQSHMVSGMYYLFKSDLIREYEVFFYWFSVEQF